MYYYGSDKGYVWHNFTTVYAALFETLRNQPIRIFELGLGDRRGASLRGWRELFPCSSVFGADINRGLLFQEDRIQTFYCDQLDPEAIRELWAQPALRGGMDILVDDGLHSFDAIRMFLDNSLKNLRVNGLYIVEDIKSATLRQWRELLPTKHDSPITNLSSLSYPTHRINSIIT
jgi:hypothetical protein